MTGIVLSGGENKRMGRDKAFLEIAGRPLIEHILQSLRHVTDKIIIVTNSPQAYSSYSAQIVTDAFDKRGPLTGIYSGLLHSTEECNVVVACDMPFLNPRLLSYMAGLAVDYDAVVPKIGEYLEPLHAVYNKHILTTIEKKIQGDQRQIKGLFNELRVRYVTEKEIESFDPKRLSFKNLNTPKEYEEVACSDLECRSC